MIQEFVSEKFDIKMEELKSKNNSPKIAMPRQVAMYMTKKLTRYPLGGNRQFVWRKTPYDRDSFQSTKSKKCSGSGSLIFPEK